jgi:mannose-6-phosphate isomerase-like protein (cupin superfamily)
MSELPVTVASFEPAGDEMFHSLRRDLGVESFGINLLTLRPGQRVHLHSRQEEVYLVLAGTLTLIVEDEPVELGRGKIARVGPEIRRQLTNSKREPAVLIALGASGEHQSRDALAWSDWDEEGEGRAPKDVPQPPDLPLD